MVALKLTRCQVSFFFFYSFCRSEGPVWAEVRRSVGNEAPVNIRVEKSIPAQGFQVVYYKFPLQILAWSLGKK